MLPTPDDSQQAVLDAPLDERRIVVAGPGAGKTTTSIALISEVSRQSADHDEQTVLYVSFSRAAMAAAFTAFGDTVRDQPINIAAMTLDSLAWQLVEESATVTGGDPDFDAVVKRATERLRRGDDEELDDVVHLIVDEAQDLSALRRELLCALIDRLPGNAGVTIFGDPMQSIYEFLDDGDVGGTRGWDGLLTDLRGRSITKIYELEGDHRSRKRGTRKVSSASQILRASGDVEREGILDDLLTEFTHWDLDEFAARASEWKGSTAVLARSNAEVLQLFQALSSLGLLCTWRQPGRVHPRVAPWVAQLWSYVGGKPLSLNDFEKFSSSRGDIDRAWFRLLLDEAGRGEVVDWSEIANTCRAAIDPLAPWFAGPRDGLALSTIHQSKGLEWDNVAVVGADELVTGVGRRQPECELLYVALSRARDRIIVIDWQADYLKRSRSGGLWYRPHPGSGVAVAVGITPDCLVSEQAIGGPGGQQVLESLSGSAQVEFERLATGHAEWPTYRCLVAGTAVGMTTPQFGRALAMLPGIRTGAWPDIGSVWTDGVETAWSTVEQVGFWLRPRPLGMATIHRKE
ncbi:AAA family ATPase [Gordonia sp. NPDC003504]